MPLEIGWAGIHYGSFDVDKLARIFRSGARSNEGLASSRDIVVATKIL